MTPLKVYLLISVALLFTRIAGAQTVGPRISILKNLDTVAPHFQGSFGTDVRPTMAAAMDINGDGLPDLVSANYYGSTVSILTNIGAARFQISQHVLVGGSPTQVIPIDLNGDSAIDMAVSVSAVIGPRLTTLTNNGSGVFTVCQTIELPIAPVSLATGDLNRDGLADIVTANYGGWNISILTNNGAGQLEIAQTVDTGPVPHGVVIDDVDHDGWLDIIICCFDSGLVQVYKNDHTCHFSWTFNAFIPDGGIPHWITAADFNEDGYTDVATANERSKTITVLTNDHTGNFIISANVPATISAYGITAGDWDGDGHIDLAVSSNDATEPAVALFRNLGNARFESPSWTLGKNISYVPTIARLDQTQTMYLVVAELLGDRLDIFAMDRNGPRLEWPADSGTWRVDESFDLMQGNWSSPNVSVFGDPVKGMNEVFLDTIGAKGFFRLAQ